MMNRKLWKVLPGTVLAGMMLASAASWSGAHPRGPEGGEGRMPGHVFEQLDLEAEQREQIKTLAESSREESKADHQRRWEIEEALREMRADFNADEAHALADELGAISARSAYRMAQTQSAIFQVLTPEQRTELDQLIEQHKERRKERFGARF